MSNIPERLSLMKHHGFFPFAPIFAALLISGCSDSPSDSPDSSESPGSSSPDASSNASASSSASPPRKAGPVENIEAKERVAATRVVEAEDPVAQEIRVFGAEIRGAFDERRFAFLEDLASELRGSGEKFGNGNWKMRELYWALNNRFHSGEDGFLTDLETHAAWREEFPDSELQITAEADFYTSYAWHARGTGYAHTVTREGWQLFADRLQKARDLLGSVKKQNRQDAYWFEVAHTVALGQGWEKEDFEELIAAAKEFDPAYWPIYAERAYSLLPRWYGEEGEWEAFAAEVADLPDGAGKEAYVRILKRLKPFYSDIFRDSRATWSRAKEGLDIFLEKYPDSVELKHYAAYLATGRDRDMAKSLFAEFGDTYVEKVWRKPERFVHFRTWAETGRW